MPAEYPVLFSPPMVRALRARRKFVTRRLDKRWLKWGRKGNRLWVREGWRPTVAHGCALNTCDCGGVNVHYFADGEDRFFEDRLIPDDWTMPKAAAKGQVTALFMPRWTSRILLECEEDAREERLHDITEEDAIAEGCQGEAVTQADIEDMCAEGISEGAALALALGGGSFTAKFDYIQLWSTLHTKPDERWEDNPVVVRVGRFHVVEGEA